MIIRNVLGLCLALSAACFAGAASAATITTIDIPGASSIDASGLDGKGNVAGTATFPDQSARGFVRRANGTVTLWDLNTRIFAVSDNGTTAGTVFSEGQGSAFVGDLNGHMTKFTVKDVPAINISDVNNSGDVIGFGYPEGGVVFRGFLRTAKGKSKVFDAPGAGTGQNQGTQALSISPNGIICGVVIDNAGVRHGFVRDTAGNFQVFDPAGAIRTTAVVIENDGTVGGSYRDSASVYHAFLRAPDGTYATFDAPGAGTGAIQGTTLLDVNKKGVMVGNMIDSGSIGHGFIRNAKGKFQVFDAPGGGTTPGFGTFAYYINDKNVLVGDAFDDQGNAHGYIRTP